MTAVELDLDAIEARVNAATDGPWEAYPDGLVWTKVPRIGDPVSGSVLPEDAEFIAAARTDVPALVAEVRRLRAVLANHDPMPGFPCDNGHCPCRSNVGATG